MRIQLLALLAIGNFLVLQNVNSQPASTPLIERRPTAQQFPEGNQINVLISPITLNKNQLKITVNGRSLKVLNLKVSPHSENYILKEERLPHYVSSTENTAATLTGNTLAITNLQKTDKSNDFEISVQ